MFASGCGYSHFVLNFSVNFDLCFHKLESCEPMENKICGLICLEKVEGLLITNFLASNVFFYVYTNHYTSFEMANLFVVQTEIKTFKKPFFFFFFKLYLQICPYSIRLMKKGDRFEKC